MENFDKELQKWAEASPEIEEEACEMLRSRHRLGISFIRVFLCVLMGIVCLKAGLSFHKSYFMIAIGIICILLGIGEIWIFYDDEKYLRMKEKKEKTRVKTVLLHEVITTRGFGVHGQIHKYLKISYIMEGEAVVRELSSFYYNRDILGLDLVGLYGKKITIAYCNKQFYILNHVYPEYDDDLKPEEKKELLKNPETIVRNLVESKDEEQIKKAELQAELVKQMNYKMAKYCSRMVNIVGGVVLCISGVHGTWSVFVGGMIGSFLILRFCEWHSCKKHCGGIWDRKKLREISKEMEKENRRG